MRADCEAAGGSLLTFLSMPPRYRCDQLPEDAAFDRAGYCRLPYCERTSTRPLGPNDRAGIEHLDALLGRREVVAALPMTYRGRSWQTPSQALPNRGLSVTIAPASPPIRQRFRTVVPRTEGVPDFNVSPPPCDDWYLRGVTVLLRGPEINVAVPAELRWPAEGQRPTAPHPALFLDARLGEIAATLPAPGPREAARWEYLSLVLELEGDQLTGSLTLSTTPEINVLGDRPHEALEVLTWPAP